MLYNFVEYFLEVELYMIKNLTINSIRALGVDSINKANSGHPGIVLGAAPMAYTLWSNHLHVNPKDPLWFNRDRFVLAAGHGSALLYSLLHLSGFDVTIDDLKNFRQLNSKTPGHPEFGYTEGVDATSGPLGQGIAMATGMAMAERYLAAKYNKENYELFNHYTYAICGDGDLMEGVTNEAISLAGHLKLGKLIVLYDSNDISLDGEASDSFSDHTIEKFKSMGWHTEYVKDGTDVEAINQAINNAKAIAQPSLIEIKTVIGFGAPDQGTNKVHGAPIGEEGAKVLRQNLGWNHEPFDVPEEVYNHFEETTIARGNKAYHESQAMLQTYKEVYPDLYQELMLALNNETKVDLAEVLPTFDYGTKDATRNFSHKCLNAVKNAVPNLIGGSADLSSSTKAMFKNEKAFFPGQYDGRNILFGVREFAMASIINGMALHGGVRPFASTFFVFSDYLKPALRLGALMHLPTLYILTHDSIAVGEDGPTHEPIEQLAMLRSIPNVQVLRPCDGNETSAAYKLALETNDKPSVLVLTRQSVKTVSEVNFANVAKGAYILKEARAGQDIDGILIASGSEVNVALDAQKMLEQENIFTRVVSMPSMELFDKQPKEYQEEVLPKSIRKRVSVEMGTSYGWHKYVGLDGATVSIDTFGASGPGDEVTAYFGFTPENVVKTFKNIL